MNTTDPQETRKDLESSAPAPGTAIHWPSVWQLGLSMLGILGLWGGSASFFLLGVGQVLAASTLEDVTSVFMLAAGLGFFGLLLLPSGGYALARLTGRPVRHPEWLRLDMARYGIGLLPLVLLLGHWITTGAGFAWLLLPPLHLIALSFPILWLLWLGSRGFNSWAPQRSWGVFGIGLLVGPLLILLAEVVAAGLLLLLGSFFLAARPELMQEAMQLAEDLRQAGQDVQAILQIVEPFLLRPEVGLTLFAFVAGIVPLIEELIKPIGVWLLDGKSARAEDGFYAGLLSGGAYALFENLALASQTQDWALAVAARAGTSLVHMTTAGLTGWALVNAWRRGAYGRLVVAFLGAIAIHGLWNGLTLMTLTGVLETGTATYLTLLKPLAAVAPLGLGLLTLLCLGLLLGIHHRLRPEA